MVDSLQIFFADLKFLIRCRLEKLLHGYDEKLNVFQVHRIQILMDGNIDHQEIIGKQLFQVIEFGTLSATLVAPKQDVFICIQVVP